MELLLVAPATGRPFATDGFAGGRGTAKGVSVEAALSGRWYGALASWGLQDVREIYGASSYAPGHGTSHLVELGLIVFPAPTASMRLGFTGALGRRGTGVLGAFEWESCNLLDQGCEFAGSPTHGRAEPRRHPVAGLSPSRPRRAQALAPRHRRPGRGAGAVRHADQPLRPAQRAGRRDRSRHRRSGRSSRCARSRRSSSGWTGDSDAPVTNRPPGRLLLPDDPERTISILKPRSFQDQVVELFHATSTAWSATWIASRAIRSSRPTWLRRRSSSCTSAVLCPTARRRG